MRYFALTIAAVMLAGCSSAPQSYLVTTPQPIDAAFGCALRQVNQLGYTVTNTNNAGGLIVAERQSSGTAAKFFTGRTNRDQLTVSIFDDAPGKGRKIRVTAAQTSERSTLLGTSHEGASKPSKDAVADANALLLACGEGIVSQQGPSFEVLQR